MKTYEKDRTFKVLNSDGDVYDITRTRKPSLMKMRNH